MKRNRLANREANGRVHRSLRVPDGPAPVAIRRQMDASLAGMSDPRWGTQLGRLALIRRITAEEFAAGLRWAEYADRYREAIDSPALHPRAQDIHHGRGHAADPDSPEGQREARRHERAMASFVDAHAALKCARRGILEAVRWTCEQNEPPIGENGMINLCAGLAVLTDFWGLTKRKNRDVR